MLALQSEIPRAEWITGSTVTSSIRAIKDAFELEALRAASGAADRVAAMLQRGEIRLIGRREADVSLAKLCARRGIAFRQATVRHADPAGRRVVTDAGEIEADFLILAMGCDTNYFGRDNLATLAPGLKTVEEGLLIGRQLEELHARAIREGRPGTMIVVGGGYTGLETASHLALRATRLTGLPFGAVSRRLRVIVVEREDELLSNVPEKTRNWAVRAIQTYGVEIRTRCTLEDISADGRARLSDGTELFPAATVWAAGVTPGEAVAGLPRAANGYNRLSVNEHLQLEGCERVFAAGDLASAARPGSQEPLRMSVQFARKGGEVAAANLLRLLRGRPLKTFDPLDPGYVVPMAPGQASGSVLGLDVRGRLPEALHYVLCVYRTRGWANRVDIVKDLLSRKISKGTDHGDES